jgi:hypothetical protein
MKRTLLLAASFSLLVLTGCKVTGTGEKIGNVVNTSPDSGFMCPTMEIEIIRGGMAGGTGANGSAFHGTVESDRKTFDFLVKAMEERREVKVKWTKEFVTWCRSESAGNYFITEATYADDPNHLPTAPVSIVTPVAVVAAASGAQAPTSETRDQKVQRLLRVQAELLSELSKQ